MSAATATTSSGPPPPPLFIFRAADAADAETGGISLIGGGRAVSVISNLCFVLFFLSCVLSRFLWGCFVGKKANLLKQTPQNKAETTIKYEEKRERERESRRVRIGACVCVKL